MHNKGNIGNADRILRAYLAIFFILSFILGRIPGVAGLTLSVVSIFLLVTAISGSCPFYRLIGIHTRRRHSDVR